MAPFFIDLMRISVGRQDQGLKLAAGNGKSADFPGADLAMGSNDFTLLVWVLWLSKTRTLSPRTSIWKEHACSWSMGGL